MSKQQVRRGEWKRTASVTMAASRRISILAMHLEHGIGKQREASITLNPFVGPFFFRRGQHNFEKNDQTPLAVYAGDARPQNCNSGPVLPVSSVRTQQETTRVLDQNLNQTNTSSSVGAG